jgi:hypothetical protein
MKNGVVSLTGIHELEDLLFSPAESLISVLCCAGEGLSSLVLCAPSVMHFPCGALVQ